MRMMAHVQARWVLIWLIWLIVAGLGGSITAVRATAQPIEPTASSPPAKGWQAVTVVRGLNRPWSLAFLPGGNAPADARGPVAPDMLITERPGPVRLYQNGKLVDQPLKGVPDALAYGQGGMMEVSLHPEFASNRYVYLTYADGTRRANHTVLARGTLSEDRTTLRDTEVIFEVAQLKPGGQHFGSRIVWLPDGTMLLAIGDGGNPPIKINGTLARDLAQDPATHNGKVLRMTDEGKPAPGNPFADDPKGDPYVWTLGHRNIQGMVRDPKTGRIWATEHGARGGDELNLLEKGNNYGWPKATYSIEYRGGQISPHRSLPGMVDPKVVWTPVLAACGLDIYHGDRFPQWQGDLLAGGLAARQIRHVDLDGNANVVKQTTLKFPHRIRDVRTGPDGFVYVLTDENPGHLLRIEPD